MNSEARMAKIIGYLDTHYREQPSLETLARLSDLSIPHFHREFCQWVGVSPKAFVKGLTLQHAKGMLDAGASVLEAALSAGLSGPGRLHDLCLTLEAATPGELKAQGEQMVVRYGSAESPFGPCQIVTSPRGICRLHFESSDEASAKKWISEQFPKAKAVPDPETAQALAQKIFLPASSVPSETPRDTLKLWVRGTRFQFQVWRALLAIPQGTLTSYQQLARALGHPRSARAVGGAVGANPIALLIPCHRVIRQTGYVEGYRWGTGRKRALIAWESALSP